MRHLKWDVGSRRWGEGCPAQKVSYDFLFVSLGDKRRGGKGTMSGIQNRRSGQRYGVKT